MLTTRDPRAPAREGGKAVARLRAGGAGGRAPPALTGSRRRAAGPGAGAGSWAAAAAAAAGESLRPARPRRRSHGGVCAGRPLARPGLLHLRPPARPRTLLCGGAGCAAGAGCGRGVRAAGSGSLPAGPAPRTPTPTFPPSCPRRPTPSRLQHIPTSAHMHSRAAHT